MGCTKLAACGRRNPSNISIQDDGLLEENSGRIQLGRPIPDLWPNGLHPKLKHVIRFIARNYETTSFHTEVRIRKMPSIWWGELECDHTASAAECFARFLNFLHALPFPIMGGSLERWRKAYNWMLVYRHQCFEISDLAAIVATKELVASMHKTDQEFAKYVIAMLYTITHDKDMDKFRYKQLEHLVKEIRPCMFDFQSREEIMETVNVEHMTRNLCYFLVEKANKIFDCDMGAFLLDGPEG